MSHIIVTNHACNLNCKYCYEHEKGVMKVNVEQIKKFVQYCYRTDKDPFLRFLLIGGEPLLSPDAVEAVCDECERLNEETGTERAYRIGIASNGTLLTQKAVQNVLTKYRDHIRLGFSIDGTQDIHDRSRVDYSGKGSYSRAIEGFRIAKEILPAKSIYAKATLSAKDFPRWSEAVINLVNEGFTSIIANYVAEQDIPESMSEMLFEQFASVTDYLFNSGLSEKVFVHECAYTDDLNKQFNFDMKNFPSPCCSMCGTPEAALTALGFDGRMYPCHRFLVRGCGSTGVFADGGIRRINQPLIDQIDRFRTLSAEKCRSCDLKHLCARCVADTFDLNNGIIPRDRKIRIWDRCGWTKAEAASWLYWKRCMRTFYGCTDMDGYYEFSLNRKDDEK